MLRYLGRRKSLIICAVISSFGNALTLIISIEALIVGRILVGLNLGVFIVAVP